MGIRFMRSGLTSAKFGVRTTKVDGVVILENLITYSNNKTAGSNSFDGRCDTYTGVNPNTTKLGVKGCLAYGSAGNGFAFTDFSIIVFEDCVARYNRRDGFNYHSLAGLTNGNYMTVYETKCKSFNQGFNGYWLSQPTLGISNNGSTCHDNINIMRVNCDHQDCFGPVVADVGGCDSLNYGVTAKLPNLTNAVLPNLGVSDDDRKTNAAFYYLTDSGTSPQRMRLIGCKGDNSTNGDALAFTLSKASVNGTFEVSNWLGGTRTEYGTITNI